jgi:hypothetical protein
MICAKNHCVRYFTLERGHQTPTNGCGKACVGRLSLHAARAGVSIPQHFFVQTRAERVQRQQVNQPEEAKSIYDEADETTGPVQDTGYRSGWLEYLAKAGKCRKES